MKTYTVVVFLDGIRHNYATSNNFKTITQFLKDALIDYPGSRAVIE